MNPKAWYKTPAQYRDWLDRMKHDAVLWAFDHDGNMGRGLVLVASVRGTVRLPSTWTGTISCYVDYRGRYSHLTGDVSDLAYPWIPCDGFLGWIEADHLLIPLLKTGMSEFSPTHCRNHLERKWQCEVPRVMIQDMRAVV